MSFCRHVLVGNRSLRGTWAQLTGWRWWRCHPPALHRWPWGCFLSQQHLSFVPGYSLYFLGASSLLFAIEAGFQDPTIDSLSERKWKCITVVWIFPSAQEMPPSCPDKQLLPLAYFWNMKIQYSTHLWSKHSAEKLEVQVQVPALNQTRYLNPSCV